MALAGTATPVGGTGPAGLLSGNTHQITGRVILYTIPAIGMEAQDANRIAESMSDLKQSMQKTHN